MKIFEKYKQNLRQDGNNIYSYNTHVATIKGSYLNQLGWWSVTTQKHINYVANELNLKLDKHYWEKLPDIPDGELKIKYQK